MKRWTLILVLLLGHAFAEDLTSPPPQLPVEIKTGFYLLNFINIDEKTQSFNADVYFSFAWKDPRLTFSPEPGETMKVFLEDAAKTKLTQIWWPQIEFMNASSPTINNESLFIYPDGNVEYYLSMTAAFRSRLDLSRFPFDQQTLLIQIDSFLWDESIVKFVTVKENVGFNSAVKTVHDKFEIMDIQEKVESLEGLTLGHLNKKQTYSTFDVYISIKRIAKFYLFQVFFPLVLIFSISCSIFFAYKEPFLDRIMISLSCMFVFLAVKFTINQTLPQIGYMTIVDKTFLIAYIGIGLSVLTTVLERNFARNNPEKAEKLDRVARWIIPALFFIACIVTIFI